MLDLSLVLLMIARKQTRNNMEVIKVVIIIISFVSNFLIYLSLRREWFRIIAVILSLNVIGGVILYSTEVLSSKLLFVVSTGLIYVTGFYLIRLGFHITELKNGDLENALNVFFLLILSLLLAAVLIQHF